MSEPVLANELLAVGRHLMQDVRLYGVLALVRPDVSDAALSPATFAVALAGRVLLQW